MIYIYVNVGVPVLEPYPVFDYIQKIVFYTHGEKPAYSSSFTHDLHYYPAFR